MNISRVIGTLFTSVILVFLASDVARGASAFAPWGPMADIEAAARKEGKLTIYTASGHSNPETQGATNYLFKEKYGVSIDWSILSSTEMPVRVLAEQHTKQYVADILMNGLGGGMATVRERGYIVPILAPSSLERGVWRVDPASSAPKDRDWLFIFMPLTPSFFVNSNLVSSVEEPKSYQDLLHPRWKGKIVLQTPFIPGGGSGWFRATYRTLGADYMRALAKQVVLVSNGNEVPDGVARGQYAIGIAASTGRGRELVQQGAPVKYLHPREGSHMPSIGTALLGAVPHPNAARLFLQWLYTKEGQTLYAKNMNAIPLRKDAPQDHIPPNERYTEGQPFLKAAPEDLTDEKAREFYGLSKQIFEEKR